MKKKPIFDWLRRKLGRGFTQAEVDQLDELLDGRAVPDVPSEPERDHTPSRTSKAGIDLIHEFEGYARDLGNGRVQAYPDPGTGGEPWTIGFGSTTDEQGDPIKRGTIWTRDRAERRFVQHLAEFEAHVVRLLGDSVDATSQAQFDALVSFAYNVGPAALGRSTLLRKHKTADHAGAAREFARWSFAGGRVMKGLARRRAAEAALYRSGS